MLEFKWYLIKNKKITYTHVKINIDIVLLNKTKLKSVNQLKLRNLTVQITPCVNITTALIHYLQNSSGMYYNTNDNFVNYL